MYEKRIQHQLSMSLDGAMAKEAKSFYSVPVQKTKGKSNPLIKYSQN